MSNLATYAAAAGAIVAAELLARPDAEPAESDELGTEPVSDPRDDAPAGLSEKGGLPKAWTPLRGFNLNPCAIGPVDQKNTALFTAGGIPLGYFAAYRAQRDALIQEFGSQAGGFVFLGATLPSPARVPAASIECTRTLVKQWRALVDAIRPIALQNPHIWNVHVFGEADRAARSKFLDSDNVSVAWSHLSILAKALDIASHVPGIRSPVELAGDAAELALDPDTYLHALQWIGGAGSIALGAFGLLAPPAQDAAKDFAGDAFSKAFDELLMSDLFAMAVVAGASYWVVTR